MMPMEDIPSPRTAGEYKKFWFVKGVPEFECFKINIQGKIKNFGY